MESLITTDNTDHASKRAAWYKIIDDFQNSGQSQVSYCKQHSINKDHFAYYLSRWRKDKADDNGAVSFVPLQVVNNIPQGKWLLNVAKDISLEVPEATFMQQLAELIVNLRARLC